MGEESVRERTSGFLKRWRRAGALALVLVLLTFPAEALSGVQEGSCNGTRPQNLKQPENPGTKESSMTDAELLTEAQGRHLLAVARSTIEAALFEHKDTAKADENLPEVFGQPRGTFVTLTKKGQLRGCIGHILPREPLVEGIHINAINAAFKDPRFAPMTPKEWQDVKVEISILTEPVPLSYSGAEDLLNKLTPGKDGVILKKGFHQATFLPQVWEQLPKKEDFLAQLCLKAGLPQNAWKKGNLEISLYRVQAFEE